MDRNAIVEQGLGEDLQASHKRSDGMLPAIVPEFRQLGSSACLANGSNIADAIGSDQMTNGFPLACFLPMPANVLGWEKASSYLSCSTQFFYATILYWIREGLIAQAEHAIRLFLGNGVGVIHHGSTTFFPEVTTIVTDEYAVAIITGTGNVQQGALQAFQAIVGPTDCGIISTLPIWYDQAIRVITLLENDGMRSDRPVMFVGHSYGASSAIIASALCKAHQPGRDVRRITFGSPKPGDYRLRNLSLNVAGIDLMNNNDLVTTLPPDRLTIAPVSATLALALLYIWDTWYPPASPAQMDFNGQINSTGLPLLDYVTLLNFTEAILAGRDLPEIFGHFMSVYRQRIALRCPVPEWPVSLAVWNYLLGIPVPAEGELVLGIPGVNLAGELKLGFHGVNLAGELVLGIPGVNLAGELVLGFPSERIAGELVLGIPGVNLAGELVLGIPGVNLAGELVLGIPGVNLAGELVLGIPGVNLAGELVLGIES